MKYAFLLIPVSLLVTACGQQPPMEAYANRGDPESLVDMSTEVVNLGLEDSSALRELTEWVNQDQPSRAELSCTPSVMQCRRAQKILDQFAVPYEMTGKSDNTVTLIYERVQARDCENRYINNTSNSYNLNHSAFGCSAVANMVQMIGDRRQLTNPSLLGYMDGEKAVQIHQDYMKPPERNTDSSSDSLLDSGN